MIADNIDDVIAQLERMKVAINEGVDDFKAHPERMTEPLKKVAVMAIDDIPPEHRGDTRRLEEAAPEILRYVKGTPTGDGIDISLRVSPQERFRVGAEPDEVFDFQSEVEEWVRDFKELDRARETSDGKVEDEFEAHARGGDDWVKQKAESLMNILANHPETFLNSENPMGLAQHIGLTTLSDEAARKWLGTISAYWQAWIEEGAEAHLELAIKKALAKV